MKIESITRSIFSPLFFILMFLNIIFPNVPNLLYVKGILFILLTIICVFDIIAIQAINISKELLYFHFVIIVLLIIPAIIGLFSYNLGAMNQLQYYIIWPTIYFLFIHMINSDIFIKIHKLLIFCTTFAGIYGLVYIFTQLSLIPSNSILDFITTFSRPDENVSQHAGYIEIDFAPLSSAPYLFLYFLTFFSLSGYKKIANWIILIAIIVLTLLSGRRALWIIFAIFPIFLPIILITTSRLKLLLNKRSLYMLTILPAMMFAILYYSSITFNLNFGSIIDQISSAFIDNAIDNSAGLRLEQISVLTDAWSEKPIFGHGLGAVASLIRSDTVPWSYEAFYYALLFQGGLFIITTVTLFAGYILINLIKIQKQFTREKYSFYFIISICLYLVASATNPYLMRIDGLWVFLFPLAYINLYKLHAPMENL